MWREIIGFEGYYEINEDGAIRGIDRPVVNSRGGTRMIRGRPVKAHNNGLGVYLHKNGSAKSISISTLLRENFPELSKPVEAIDGEIWLSVPGWLCYEASNLGRIKRLSRPVDNGYGVFILPEILIRQTPNKDGYLTLQMNDGESTKFVMAHRVIAWAFIGPGGDEDEINHKDFDRKNNNKDNLEWKFHIDNVKYSKDAERYSNNGKVPQ